MKKNLTRKKILYHYYDGIKIGAPISYVIYGTFALKGDYSELYGDCSGLKGECSGLHGECTGLMGNLDDCEIIDEDRKNGIDIQNLIKEDLNVSESAT